MNYDQISVRFIVSEHVARICILCVLLKVHSNDDLCFCSISCCFAGGEAGVDVADALSEYLGLQSNGTGIENRRDK